MTHSAAEQPAFVRPPVAGALQMVATTDITGFPLVNGTPTILSWTAPNDSQMHRVLMIASQSVSSPETGGLVQFHTTDVAGNVVNNQVFPGGSAAGGNRQILGATVAPGSTTTVFQASALTAGAAVEYIELWAS